MIGPVQWHPAPKQGTQPEMIAEQQQVASTALQTIVSHPMFQTLDLVGILALSVSGAIIAATEGYSLYGALVLAALPAIGGGFLRDLLAGVSPPSMMEEADDIQAVIATVLAGYLFNLTVHQLSGRSLVFYDLVQIYVRAKRRISPQVVLEIMDAVGMAALTVVGVHVALQEHAEPLWLWGPVFSAVTTTGGFICRDAIRSDRRIAVLKTTIYGEVSIVWALVLSLFILYFGERASPGAAQAAVYGAAVGAFLTRLALIIRKISAPAFRGTSTPATLDDH